MKRLISIGLMIAIMPASVWAQAVVESVRSFSEAEQTRIVFDLSAAAEHELFALENPDRIVLDLRNTELASGAVEPPAAGGPVSRIRTGLRGDGVRVVFDLDKNASAKSFALPPSGTRGHRVVLDLAHTGGTSPVPVPTPVTQRQEFVVAIDAGHGGKDPGAIGAGGTREKDVVLAVAKRLADRVNAVDGLRAVLIRDGDYFIALRERTRRARDANADLFISLHADAFNDRRVRGSSVFILSRTGASSEMARMLARRENAADRIGGVTLHDKDEQLASVLMDLSRAHTIEESMGVAEVIRGELARVGDVHGQNVEQAGFAVLKSLDMPSILVELAFISNPDEERRLRSSAYQEQLATGLLQGIRRHVSQQNPSFALGDGQHVVQRGDTLSQIANRYRVSIDALRQANGIGNDMLTVGRTLQIP